MGEGGKYHALSNRRLPTKGVSDWMNVGPNVLDAHNEERTEEVMVENAEDT